MPKDRVGSGPEHVAPRTTELSASCPAGHPDSRGWVEDAYTGSQEDWTTTWKGSLGIA